MYLPKVVFTLHSAYDVVKLLALARRAIHFRAFLIVIRGRRLTNTAYDRTIGCAYES